MSDNTNEISLTTLKEIFPKVVEDNFFRNAPFLAYMRDHCLVPFGGGEVMQNTFMYRSMIGGFYARGDNFNLTKPQTLAGTFFDPKFVYVNVTEHQEDVQVVNKGPLAVYSLIDLDMRNAMNTISAICAIAMANHGQPTGTGIVGSRPKAINGWIEAINDGITPGWDGSYFTSYGTQTRNGTVGSTLNSVPYWCGTQAGATGLITYPILEEAYQDASIGNENPDLIVANKAAYAYMKERIQVQQRFAQEKDPIWGVMGFRFNDAMVLKDDYFPSKKYGETDSILGNWLTATYTSPGTTGTTSNMPISTVLTVGEVIGMFNTKKWLVRITDDEEFGFGFSGFKPAQDNTRVAGQIKAMLNLQCKAPRLQKQLFGIGG